MWICCGILVVVGCWVGRFVLWWDLFVSFELFFVDVFFVVVVFCIGSFVSFWVSWLGVFSVCVRFLFCGWCVGY